MNIHLLQTTIFFTFLFMQSILSQSSWEQLNDYPSIGIERMFSFEIDGTVYIGTGREANTFNTSNVWAYDVTTDIWTAMADFPGDSRRSAFGFSAGGYGYIGTGYNGTVHTDDFWKYDPGQDTWTQLDDFPGGIRSHAMAISGNTKAYVAAGGSTSDNLFYNDLWEFNTQTESWTLLGNFPGEERWRTYGWLIDQKVYVGGGNQNPSDGFLDLYSYNLTTSTWQEEEACPTVKTIGGFHFAFQNKGYFVEGALQTSGSLNNYGNKVFVYAPATNNWEEDTASFIGEGRVLGFSEVVDNMVIAGLGRNYENDNYYRDVYVFTPDLSTATTNFVEDLQVNVFPNPIASAELFVQAEFIKNAQVVYNIYDIDGKLKLSTTDIMNAVTSDVKSLNIKPLVQGIYHLEIIHDNQKITRQFIKL